MIRFLILLVLIGTAFAVPRHMQRIVGGQGTTVEAYPYMSNMQYHMLNMIWTQWCGGSLITSRTVLSAAHCYEGDAHTSWRVFLGSSRSNGHGGSLHPVSQITIHEHYDRTTLNADVAIVRLSVPAVYGPTVRVARLPANVYNVADGSAVHAVGWGLLYSDGPRPEQLQHVQLYTINQKICTDRYDFLRTQPGFEHYPGVTPGMICAGILDQGGRDSCQGDAGGPLAHLGDIILGITSWGYGCGHPLYPGVNVRVSHYTDWIVKTGAS